jgi:hypothetical protein
MAVFMNLLMRTNALNIHKNKKMKTPQKQEDEFKESIK